MIQKILLFDIDGTLLLTGGVGADAFNIVFKEMFGIDDAWGSCIPDGKTDPIIIEEVAQASLGRKLNDSEYEKLCVRYLEIFDRDILKAERFRLMPGVPGLLEQLSRDRKLALGVATGNFERAAWSKLERGGIRHHFGFGGFASDSALRPELTRTALLRGHEAIGKELDPGQVFVIGDTIWDIHAGKHIGSRTVGIATGRYSVGEFKAAGADFAFPDLTDLAGFLKMIES